MTKRVPFSATAVYTDDDGLLGVAMDCLLCGEGGWKGPDAMDEHARTHLDDAHVTEGPEGVVTYAVPLKPGADIVVEFPFPPSNEDWDYFVGMLNAVRSRLVEPDRQPEPSPAVDEED